MRSPLVRDRDRAPTSHKKSLRTQIVRERLNRKRQLLSYLGFTLETTQFSGPVRASKTYGNKH
jgi:hypothetical protein